MCKQIQKSTVQMKETDFEALPDMQCRIFWGHQTVQVFSCHVIVAPSRNEASTGKTLNRSGGKTVTPLPYRRRHGGGECHMSGELEKATFTPLNTHHLLFSFLMLVRLRKHLRTHSVATSPSAVTSARCSFITSRDISKIKLKRQTFIFFNLFY